MYSDKMIGILLIATTLATRGIYNWNEAMMLAIAPQIAVANYTYHYLKNYDTLNYSEIREMIDSINTDSLTNMTMDDIYNSRFVMNIKNTTEVLMADMPNMTEAVSYPSKILSTIVPSMPPIPYKMTGTIDPAVLYVSIYLAMLFSMISVVCILNPGASMRERAIDTYDEGIVVRKRRRVPVFYEEDRMLLRSMTDDDDVFYEMK